MKKVTIIALVLLFIFPATCLASTFSDAWHSQQNRIGVDKIAHFGCGYIIQDCLKKNTKLTFVERTLTVAAIAAAKEEFADAGNWDRNDFYATVLGGLVSEIKLVIRF